MFIKLIGRLFSQATAKQKQRHMDTRKETVKALRLFRDTCARWWQRMNTGSDAVEMLDREIGWNKLLQTQSVMEAMVKEAEPDRSLFMIEWYLRSALRRRC